MVIDSIKHCYYLSVLVVLFSVFPVRPVYADVGASPPSASDPLPAPDPLEDLDLSIGDPEESKSEEPEESEALPLPDQEQSEALPPPDREQSEDLPLSSPSNAHKPIKGDPDKEEETLPADTMDDVIVSEDLEEYEYLSDDEVLRYILSEVQIIRDSMSGPALATPSEVQASKESEEEMLESEVFYADNASLYTSLSLPSHDCVWFRGTFNGSSYILVFPLESYSSLNVAENGVLYNLSSGNITGRLFQSETFNSNDYEYRTFTLYPVFGNSASQVYNNRSLSYMTHYYLGNYDRLTSSTTYGDFTVDEVEVKRSVSVSYRTYYMASAILFLLGVIVLCLWKSSRRS